SREMIRLPDAAYIPPSLPGRAYFLVGNDLQEFQTAWVGMDYDESQFADEPDESPITLRLLHAEHLVKPAEAAASPRLVEQAPEENAERIPTLAEALSKYLTTSFTKMKLQPTETVFLESLADEFPLQQVLDLGQYGGWDGSD